MKNKIENMICKAAKKAFANGELPSSDIPDVIMEIPKAESHGDFSTNIAMVMASAQKMKPQKIAEIITANIADTEKILSKTEIAGPGFINFFIKESSWHPVLRNIHNEDEHYGASSIGQKKNTGRVCERQPHRAASCGTWKRGGCG